MNDEAVQCSKCSAEMYVGAHFCMRCGAQLSDSAPQLELELELELEHAQSLPVDAEQSSTKLRAAQPVLGGLAPASRVPAAAPSIDSSSKMPVPPSMRARVDTLRLTPHADSRDSAAEPALTNTNTNTSTSTSEPGSGPRASSRPSAVPFMERAAATPSDAQGGLAGVDLAAPSSMSEALLRASQLPDFSIDDIDDGFASIQDKDSQRAQPADSLAGAYADMQSLFSDMVAAHVAPIRDLLLELETGGARREWLDLCRPAARALKNAAEQLPDRQLHRALRTLSDALEAASPPGSARIEEPERKNLREAYAALSSLLPSVSALDDERARREPIIIQAIFQCTVGLGRVQRDKLVAAGFTGLSTLCMARADELASASGIPFELAERLVLQVEHFKRAAAQSALDANRAGERDALAQLTRRLRQQNEAFEASRQGWSRQDQDAKRRAQRAREQTLAQASIVLAQLGELALIDQLEKLPFERKLSELERFLDVAQNDRQRYSQASGGE